MCTALTYRTTDAYFGRNLDLEYAYEEQITVTPRRFALALRRLPPICSHYAMIGTAYVPDTFPLYYDAVNEHGLAMAGLNFPVYAHYTEPCDGALAPFEVIPWMLAQCRTVGEACRRLARIPIAAIDYSKALPLTPLHWLLADGTDSVAVEPTKDGLQLIRDPAGVLTNSPPLAHHLTCLAEYTTLSPHTPPACLGDIPVSLYSRGMGTRGLPGDLSSVSRFVRAAFFKAHSLCDGSEAQSVMQMFHILDSVAHPRGAVILPDGKAEITVYSSCCNLRTGVYYYKTYNGSRIRAVDLRCCDRNGDKLYCHPMVDEFEIEL